MMKMCNRQTLQTLVAGLAGLAMLAGLAGCSQAEWDDPEYINNELKTADSIYRAVALRKLDTMEDEQQRKAIPGLVDTYLKGGPNADDAMKFLVRLRDEEATDAYLQEMKENNAGFPGQAAEALGELKVEKAVPEMLNLYKESTDPSVQQAVLRGMEYMPDPSMIEPLVNTLKLDVDNYPIALHSYSCDILGDIAQKNPGEFGEDQIRTMVRAMYLSNIAGQNIKRECSLAIQKLGKPAVPALMEVFRGENKDVEKLMMTFAAGEGEFPMNRPKPAAVQRLVTMRAEEAIDPLLEWANQEHALPETGVPKAEVRSWFRYEAQTVDEIIMGLGDLRAQKAQDFLVDVLTGEMNDEWEGILDPLLELQLRQDAGKALVRLGNREAAGPLMQMALEGVIKDLERRARFMEKSEDMEAMDVLQRYQFNWMSAKLWANLATGDQIDDLNKLINLEFLQGEKMKKVRERLKEFKPMLELAKECMAKESNDAKASCYGEGLKSDNEYVREKAAWELSRLPKEASASILNENLSTDHLGTREILELTLYENGNKKTIETIGKILEDEADETADRYEMDRFRLRLLRAYLRNNL